jgi:hypothetical protein
MSKWHELEHKYFMNTVVRVPLTIVRGQGARVWDEDGREYLDFVGGWSVNSLGHCPPVVVEAVVEQVRTLIQASNHAWTKSFFVTAGLRLMKGRSSWRAGMESIILVEPMRLLPPAVPFMVVPWLWWRQPVSQSFSSRMFLYPPVLSM